MRMDAAVGILWYDSGPLTIIDARLTRSGHCTSFHPSGNSPFVLQASSAWPQSPGLTSFESGSRARLNHHASGFDLVALSREQLHLRSRSFREA